MLQLQRLSHQKVGVMWCAVWALMRWAPDRIPTTAELGRYRFHVVVAVRRLAVLLALASCAGETSFESEHLPYSFELDSVRISGGLVRADGGVSTTLIMTNLTDQAVDFGGLDERMFVAEIYSLSLGRLHWAAADSPLVSECRSLANVWQIEPHGSVRFTRFVELKSHDLSELQIRFRVLVRDGSPVEIAPRFSPM